MRYPVGSLLVWVTRTEGAPARGDGQLTPGSVELILDGQQRMTTPDALKAYVEREVLALSSAAD